MAPSSSISLSIIVIGGGLAGLPCAIRLAQSGHHVHVIERRKEGFAADLGGGVQLTKNSTRIIEDMGLYEELLTFSLTHRNITVRQYKNGEVIRTLAKRNPSHMVHRADVVRLFYRAAERVGVQTTLGKAVVGIDVAQTRPLVHLSDGLVLKADLVVGADGNRKYFSLSNIT